MGTFSALALQMDCVAVNRLSERSQVEQAMTAAIHKVGQQIAGSKAFINTFSGDVLKLVVLPEYFLTSFPMGEKYRGLAR